MPNEAKKPEPISPEAAQKYVESGGSHCPYCGTEDIDGGAFDWDDPLGRDVSCNNCGKEWVEILQVIAVEPKG